MHRRNLSRTKWAVFAAYSVLWVGWIIARGGGGKHVTSPLDIKFIAGLAALGIALVVLDRVKTKT